MERTSARQLYRCSRCKGVWYCSPQCQRRDWPKHKLICTDPTKIDYSYISEITQEEESCTVDINKFFSEIIEEKIDFTAIGHRSKHKTVRGIEIANLNFLYSVFIRNLTFEDCTFLGKELLPAGFYKVNFIRCNFEGTNIGTLNASHLTIKDSVFTKSSIEHLRSGEEGKIIITNTNLYDCVFGIKEISIDKRSEDRGIASCFGNIIFTGSLLKRKELLVLGYRDEKAIKEEGIFTLDRLTLLHQGFIRRFCKNKEFPKSLSDIIILYHFLF